MCGRPQRYYDKEWEELMKKARERRRKQDEEYYRQRLRLRKKEVRSDCVKKHVA